MTMTASWMSRVKSEERLRRLERATDVPLLLLALILVPLLVLPLVVDLDPGVERAFRLGDTIIWAAFALDFALKLLVAPRAWAYARTHRLQAAMVVLPFLRPLRFLRLLPLVRVAVVIGFDAQVIRSVSRHRGTKFVVAAVLFILFAGATLGLLAERQNDGANIDSFGIAVWWSAVTISTVGYGDFYPTTTAGRAVASALMLFGIAALSVVTASLGAIIVRQREDVQMADVVNELRALRAELADLRQGEGTE